MNFIKFNIHNIREGILTVNKKHFTCISDQKLNIGDVIMHPQYTRLIADGINTFVIKEIEEERPSIGDWKTTPSTFRKIVYKKETIPFSVAKQAGYVKTEIVTENGKQQEKNFLML